MSTSPFVIAEVGVNHNGDLDVAHALIKAAGRAGANAVKFQTFVAESLVTQTVERASYQEPSRTSTSTQLSMLRALQLPLEWYSELASHARELGLVFMSTPFDDASANFLVDHVKIDRVKIPSGELTNLPFVWRLASYGLPIILSTGMATMPEVEDAVAAVALASSGAPVPSNLEHFQVMAQESRASRFPAMKNYLTLLHCTSAYPTDLADVNLRAMTSLNRRFGVPVGLSDHTLGYVAAVGAVALGAQVIEKHITLDRNMRGPDHKASIEPRQFEEFVRAVREASLCLGTSGKAPTRTEQENSKVVRKSVVAANAISEGALFTHDNLTAKRAGSGLSPSFMWNLLGTRARRHYEKDELID